MVDNIEDVSVENSNSISMIRHKIVFIGDPAVGKTSILNRFLEDKFKEFYEVIVFYCLISTKFSHQ